MLAGNNGCRRKPWASREHINRALRKSPLLHKSARYEELPLKFPYPVPLDFWGADRKTTLILGQTTVQLLVSL